MVQEQTANTAKDFNKLKTARFIMAFLIGFIIVFSAAAGAWTMCKHSGGVIERGSYACKQIEIMGLCESGDSLYVIPQDKLDTSAFNLSMIE